MASHITQNSIIVGVTQGEYTEDGVSREVGHLGRNIKNKQNQLKRVLSGEEQLSNVVFLFVCTFSWWDSFSVFSLGINIPKESCGRKAKRRGHNMINRFHIVRQALTYMKINEGKKSSKTTLVVVGILLIWIFLGKKKKCMFYFLTWQIHIL